MDVKVGRKKNIKVLFHVFYSIVVIIIINSIYRFVLNNGSNEDLMFLITSIVFFLIFTFAYIDFIRTIFVINDLFICNISTFSNKIYFKEVNRIIISKKFIQVFNKESKIKINSEFDDFMKIKSFIIEKVSNNENIEINKK